MLDSDKRDYSLSGVEFLSSKVGIDDKDILECVKYHHAKNLSSANVAKDSLAYIACIADNIASAADRREEEEGYFRMVLLGLLIIIIFGLAVAILKNAVEGRDVRFELAVELVLIVIYFILYLIVFN